MILCSPLSLILGTGTLINPKKFSSGKRIFNKKERTGTNLVNDNFHPHLIVPDDILKLLEQINSNTKPQKKE